MRSVKVYEENLAAALRLVGCARVAEARSACCRCRTEEEGVKRIGECTPYPRYGESDASVMAQIMSIVPQLEKRLTREALKLLPAGAAPQRGDSALMGFAGPPALKAKALPGCSRRDAVPVFTTGAKRA